MAATSGAATWAAVIVRIFNYNLLLQYYGVVVIHMQ